MLQFSLMKNLKILTILLLISFGCLTMVKTTLAATFQSTINISTRDGNYGALPNVSFVIYKQKTDIDGRRLPGDQVASGNTKDKAMATVKINVDNRSPMYLAKFYTKNANVAPIYYYDLDLTNTYTYNFIARLSSLRIILQNAEGKILTNQKFNLYTQKTGLTGTLKGDLYASNLATNNQGYSDVYLAEGAYLIELLLDGGTTFIKDNLKVTKEQKTTLIYPISELVITIKDEKGVALPKQKFEIYTQTTDNIGQPTFGKKIIATDTGEGIKKLLLPPNIYGLKIFNVNRQADSLFGQVLTESNLLIINYSPSNLRLILKDANRNYFKNKEVAIFTQNCASCGNFLGARVASAKTNNCGEANFQLTPGIYVIKIAALGGVDYYFYDQKIAAGENKILTEYLSSIRIIGRRGNGDILKNVLVSITSQKLDINQKPLSDKIIATLNTKDVGFADLYLPAGNYFAIFNKNIIANLKVERAHLTQLTILETEKGFSYPVKIVFLGEETLIKPKITLTIPRKKIINNFYSQKRLSLDLEQTLARQLKEKLEHILGQGKIGVSSENWPILVNAHIYGGYAATEIAHTIKNGPLVVHPTIPAAVWRGSADYQKYLARVK